MLYIQFEIEMRMHYFIYKKQQQETRNAYRVLLQRISFITPLPCMMMEKKVLYKCCLDFYKATHRITDKHYSFTCNESNP